MKRILQIIIHNNFIKFGIIPTILLFLWLFIAVVTYPGYSLSIISYNHSYSDLTLAKKGELLKNDRVKGEFTAPDNNLGIVAVRFTTYNRINSDSLLFRIKEAGQKNWYYQNTYKVDQFQPEQLFPFGFPLIAQSNGKKYIFEIVSLKGEKNDAIAISSTYPSFVSRYKYTPKEVLQNKEKFLSFLNKKIIDSLTDVDLLRYSIIFCYPFFFYLGFLLFDAKQRSSRLLLYITLSFFIIDILLVKYFSTVSVIELIISWILVIYLYKFDSVKTLYLSIFFMVITPFFLAIQQTLHAEKTARWVYLLLCVILVQLIIEMRKNKKTTLQKS